jgi:hypothetical protein
MNVEDIQEKIPIRVAWWEKIVYAHGSINFSMPTLETQNEVAFVSSGKESETPDSTYNDFFQETWDGSISIGKKAQKSGLEITTTILGYILPVMILWSLFSGFHVYIQQWGGAKAIQENYTFLCPYLNYAIESNTKNCDTLATIEKTYSDLAAVLQADILKKLSDYIPVKLTKNILLRSPERSFTETTYKNKLHVDVVMDKFEEIRSNAESSTQKNNITCNGMSITGEGMITTQCTVYGGSSGNDDENGRLGSARIEALRFVNILSDTSKSQFILLNPPTSLSMEKISDSKEFTAFTTRTTLSIQAKYVPFPEKN